MKLKRLVALALALVSTLSLLAVPAAAATYSDLTTHWSKNDVEYLAGQGIIGGYPDGTYKPDGKMTACEALLFCARATGLDNASKQKIADARRAELSTLLPANMAAWASDEMAICLEVGIITHNELAAMCQSGAISREISRENLSFYLTRAMQLAPLAQSLTTYSMGFTDAASISPGLQPYVYLLNLYSIINGDDKNRFDPRGSITRGAMAALLRRSMDFMKARGIVVELPEYTTYPWVGGTIAAASNNQDVVLLTLSNEVSGTQSVSLPVGIKIYENNMITTTNALKVGQYARVNLNAKGAPAEVRLGGALTTHQGSVSSLEDGSLLLVEDNAKVMEIDRFTSVQVGKVSGDRTLIDEEAGYSTAICQVDELGHLATVKLTGGTRTEVGVIAAVEKTGVNITALQLSGFDGVKQRYTITNGAGVTVNGVTGTLNTNYVGKYATLRVNNDNGEVMAITIDTQTRYIQGAVKGTSYNREPNTITVRDVFTGKTETYNVASNAEVAYDGVSTNFGKVTNNWFVTLMFSGEQVILLDGYPGTSSTNGIISAINYGTPTILSVKRADDTIVTFELDLESLPTIYRNSKASTFDKLRSGDQVSVTVRYNQVESIEATPQSANMSGTINRITMETSGVTLEMSLTDGTSATYQVGEGVSVTQDSKAISLFSLKPGFKVSMVVNGTQVVSIEVDKSTANAGQINGKVIIVNNSEKNILMEVSDANGTSSVVTVYAGDANFVGIDGSVLYLNTLKTGDNIQIYGAYDGLNFKATLIIRA